MTRRDTLESVHEPFGDAFYFGPERLSERYEGNEKERVDSGFAESTFKTVLDRLDDEAKEVRSEHFSSSCADFARCTLCAVRCAGCLSRRFFTPTEPPKSLPIRCAGCSSCCLPYMPPISTLRLCSFVSAPASLFLRLCPSVSVLPSLPLHPCHLVPSAQLLPRRSAPGVFLPETIPDRLCVSQVMSTFHRSIRAIQPVLSFRCLPHVSWSRSSSGKCSE